MQDLEQRVLLERQVDNLLTARDLDVEGLAKQARDAIKRGDYDGAKKLADKAQKMHKPLVRVVKVICDAGKAQTFASARRYIQSGIVSVDGVKLRKHDAVVHPEQVVTFKGEVIQGAS